MRETKVMRAWSRAALMALVLYFGAPAHAAIPAGERNVLQSLYASTNGAGWTTSTDWNGAAGTECSWYGIVCNAGGTTVTNIELPQNNLSGLLPALAGLPNLVLLEFYDNQLTGPFPTLAGLPNLSVISIGANQLSGSLPSFAGLTNLGYFFAFANQLSGPIPSLAGLPNLVNFTVNGNHLSGTIPALAGLTNLNIFVVNDNQLTGTIPALAGLTSFSWFSAAGNQLTGTIPPLAATPGLAYFDVGRNQLTGTVPALAGLTNLRRFTAASNQLTGSIPALAGLTSLDSFDVGTNQLTGSIPALAGLTKLSHFYVNDNQLTGEVPPVPNPNALEAGGSALCPNALNPTPNVAWDAATGSVPWYLSCTGVATYITDLTDIWWNAAESGWGMQLVHAGTFIFGTLYLYNVGEQSTWVSVELNQTGTSPLTYAGPLYVTTGPWFGGPFDPAMVTARQAGTMTFVATGPNSGQITYSVDGVVVNKAVTRQPVTLDDYSGNYVATASGVRSGCLDAADDGVTTVPVTVQIVQGGTTMSAAWTFDDGDVCTDTGTYSQLGRMGMLVANYTCTSGDSGSSTYSEMTTTLGTFAARLAVHSTTRGCMTVGRVSGLIPN